MKPAPFEYVRPTDVGEAVPALAEAGEDGAILAGGQSLVPLMAMRRVAAGELFTGPLQTSLATGEMITAVDFPAAGRGGFAELARRRGDFGLVTVEAAETGGGIQIAVGGVGAVPYWARAAEAVLAGTPPTPAHIDKAAALTAAGAEPANDVHADGAYRRATTAENTRRALSRLLGERRPAWTSS